MGSVGVDGVGVNGFGTEIWQLAYSKYLIPAMIAFA